MTTRKIRGCLLTLMLVMISLSVLAFDRVTPNPSTRSQTNNTSPDPLIHLKYDQRAYKSGCCSWHKGVCGCSANGRVVCCDDTLSTSCLC